MMWSLNTNGQVQTPLPLFSNAFSTWQQVNWWLQYENLDPLNGSPGYPIYTLILLRYLCSKFNDYAVVDVNQSHVDPSIRMPNFAGINESSE